MADFLELYGAPLLSLLLGYLLGSIPFGIVLTRIFGAGDLRSIGSGNIGATNVLRTGRKGLAAATLLLDMLKGTAAVLLIGAIWPQYQGLAAIGALVGHLYPVWLRFNGGKGVATFLGILIALHWQLAAIYALVWLLVLFSARYSSLAGITAALLTPVWSWLFGRIDLAILFLAFALLIFWKHRGNVARLLSGTEPRVGAEHG